MLIVVLKSYKVISSGQLSKDIGSQMIYFTINKMVKSNNAASLGQLEFEHLPQDICC